MYSVGDEIKNIFPNTCNRFFDMLSLQCDQKQYDYHNKKDTIL
ncbi:hypothetical protein HMPREF3202_01967 [Prevotella bivia]|uniref:Uncharacterized protein n=1 Tax=Prevotella bivia TaxID=28125 RepID=A0A137SSD4_9BACT|nr:hypothetical protein HMPREF3202_01967 [Prevotella bivia]